MIPAKGFSNWVEVDLQAIQANIDFYRRRTGVPVMAVVKANAYGHGMIPVARAALSAGAHWFGVARIEEAMALRDAGLSGPILVLGYLPPGQLEAAVNRQISLAVWEARQVAAAGEAARQAGQTARLHLKVDTGMGRLGVTVESAGDLAALIQATPGVEFEGLFTHFARADEADPGPTEAQEKQLAGLVEALTARGLRPPWVHAANSAAGLRRPSAAYDLVRVGIAMYGLPPSPECPLPPEIRPALAWKSVLSQVKTLPAGRGVSYGHIYQTQGRERIGTIPVGYADGYRRVNGNQVLVRGRIVPVVGRVCMDQIMVQLDQAPGARAGDEVVLLGSQGEVTIQADDIARQWGTINYEVTSGIAARVPRLYSPED